MINYTAFLRGINVGGSKVIKMDILKEIFLSMKLTDVKTFIQSGNVLFKSSEKDKEKLRKKIEQQLFKSLNLNIVTLLRSDEEIKHIIDHNPFNNSDHGSKVMLYISLLPEEPGKEALKKLIAVQNENEKFKVIKDNVYCHINKNVKTLFSNNWLEKKLGLPATTRNINTIEKISALLK